MYPMKSKGTILLSSLLVIALLVSIPSFKLEAQRKFGEDKQDTLTIAVSSWTSAMASAELVKYILENEVGINVKLLDMNLGAAFQALEKKDLDILIEGWLPTAQSEYWDKSSKNLVTFGPVAENAFQGWVVPDYIPEDKLSAIEDLKDEEVRKKLNGEITGISPGTGIMEHSHDMIEQYELENYKLVPSSDYAMMAQLKRAIQKKEWIVVTLWRPHVAFYLHDLRFLSEPKNLQGTEEGIYIIAREDILNALPSAVTEFLARYYMPISKVDELVSAFQEEEDMVAPIFVEDNPKLVDYWLNGVSALENE